MPSSHAHESSYLDLCIETLKESGLRVTKTRTDVASAIDAISSTFSSTFTLKSLHEILENQGGFDFATLYRIVQTFEKLGLIHPASSSGTYLPCHHLECNDFIHVIYSCGTCAATFESHLPKRLASQISTELKKSDDFHAERGILQVMGYCPACRAT